MLQTLGSLGEVSDRVLESGSADKPDFVRYSLEDCNKSYT